MGQMPASHSQEAQGLEIEPDMPSSNRKETDLVPPQANA